MKRALLILLLTAIALSSAADAKESKQMRGIVSQIRRAQVDISPFLSHAAWIRQSWVRRHDYN